jgi:hypothetical protein
MFARTLLALLLMLGLVTGTPALACGAKVLPEDCACCPVEQTRSCCMEAPVDAPAESPMRVTSVPVDLKLAMAPVLKVVAEAVESGGFVPAPVDDRGGRDRERTVFERIGIRLI